MVEARPGMRLSEVYLELPQPHAIGTGLVDSGQAPRHAIQPATRWPLSRSLVFVPGKSPKPLPAVHRDYLWRCLRRGVQRCDPQIAEQLDACRFLLAAWNFLYYGEHESLAADVPWIERLIESEGATAADVSEARRWSKWLTRLLYALGDNAHWLIPWIPDPRVKAMIQDTLRYFENTGGIADRIRAAIKAEIQEASEHSQSVCVVSHSMGTVIAYESLWELTHEDGRPAAVDLFLTLGSPLGMNYVQKRLLGFRDGARRYPAGIGKWVNVAAVGDLVSVDQRIADDFSAMVEDGLTASIEDIHRDVYTAFRNGEGLNPHRSYGYLVHPAVGGAIVDWWRGGE